MTRQTQENDTSGSKTDTSYGGFTDEERGAMKERARELKTAARRVGGAKGANDEGAVRAKIAEMSEPDRGMAERIHAVIRAAAPELSPTLWYGMPAYARNGKVVCFFQPAKKFKARYSTLGFNDAATLDDGTMWPTAFALTELTPDAEARIGALARQAAG